MIGQLFHRNVGLLGRCLQTELALLGLSPGPGPGPDPDLRLGPSRTLSLRQSISMRALPMMSSARGEAPPLGRYRGCLGLSAFPRVLRGYSREAGVIGRMGNSCPAKFIGESPGT